VTDGYDASSLTYLEGLEAVRKRPGMYIGSTDSRGLQHCMWEIVDNAVDEALAGHCKRIEIILHPDHSIEVRDDGRGIPVDVEQRTKLPGVVLVFTKLHAGGKFGDGGYKVSGGLHGVGASVVNALSSRLDVEVDRDGMTHTISFQRGEPGTFNAKGDFTADAKMRKGGKSKTTGTRVRYWADEQIFLPGSDINLDATYARARQTAFLVPRLEIVVDDQRGDDPVVETFRFDGGVSDFVEYLAPDEAIAPAVVLSGVGTFTETVPMLEDGKMVSRDVERECEVEVAMRWGKGYDSHIKSFVNIVATPKGGTHVVGFERALSRTLNDAAKTLKALRANEEGVNKDDCLEGLTAIVAVKLEEPQFEGQTKEILGTNAAQQIVSNVVASGLKDWFANSKNKRQAKIILDKVVGAARTRRALRTQRETIRRKNALESSTLPAKLADCHSNDLERAEVFLVEGDSAMGCCFRETNVVCLDGQARTMGELEADWKAGVTHFGWASDEDGDVVAVPLLEPRLTKRDAAVVEVLLDNGETIVCTPDHPFRLRDGSYLRADHLEPGQSLMPLYRKVTTKKPMVGYEMLWHNGRSKWEFSHRVADKRNTAERGVPNAPGTVCHHADFNKRNNDPRNLVRMGRTEHILLHMELGREVLLRLWADPQFAEAAHQRGIESWADPEYRAKHTAINQERTRRADQIETRVQGFYKWLDSLDEEEYARILERLDEEQRIYWADPENRRIQSERVARYFEEHPEAREQRRKDALEQWSDEDLRAWRAEETRRWWTEHPEMREQHGDAVRAWREAHPEFSEHHSASMRAYHEAHPDLRERSKAGIQRWRDEVGPEVRSSVVRNGHRQAALRRLARVVDEPDPQAAYDELRMSESRTSPRWATLLDAYDGDQDRLLDAARNVNHQVVSVRALDERVDVYDLTVDGYHNFALEAGVFVHNSAKAARNSDFQALLPLRGKILNVLRSTEAQMLNNAECQAIIAAVGAGSGKTFDVEQIRYGKIILLTDADVDGSHIRCLLLTLFYRYMRPLLEHGHVYAAVPPLYRITIKGSGEHRYTFSDEERDTVIAEIKAAGKDVREIQRYKGLGEMDADQLGDTTMEAAHRKLRRLSVDDGEAMSALFDILMGNDPSARRDFITENTHLVDPGRLDY
jgi:DNA gyrase subunit B